MNKVLKSDWDTDRSKKMIPSKAMLSIDLEAELITERSFEYDEASVGDDNSDGRVFAPA